MRPKPDAIMSGRHSFAQTNAPSSDTETTRCHSSKRNLQKSCWLENAGVVHKNVRVVPVAFALTPPHVGLPLDSYVCPTAKMQVPII